MLLAFAPIIRFTSLSGLASVAALNIPPSAEVDQRGLSPDHFDSQRGGCHEI